MCFRPLSRKPFPEAAPTDDAIERLKAEYTQKQQEANRRGDATMRAVSNHSGRSRRRPPLHSLFHGPARLSWTSEAMRLKELNEEAEHQRELDEVENMGVAMGWDPKPGHHPLQPAIPLNPLSWRAQSHKPHQIYPVLRTAFWKAYRHETAKSCHKVRWELRALLITDLRRAAELIVWNGGEIQALGKMCEATFFAGILEDVVDFEAVPGLRRAVGTPTRAEWILNEQQRRRLHPKYYRHKPSIRIQFDPEFDPVLDRMWVSTSRIGQRSRAVCLLCRELLTAAEMFFACRCAECSLCPERKRRWDWGTACKALGLLVRTHCRGALVYNDDEMSQWRFGIVFKNDILGVRPDLPDDLGLRVDRYNCRAGIDSHHKEKMFGDEDRVRGRFMDVMTFDAEFASHFQTKVTHTAQRRVAQ